MTTNIVPNDLLDVFLLKVVVSRVFELVKTNALGLFGSEFEEHKDYVQLKRMTQNCQRVWESHFSESDLQLGFTIDSCASNCVEKDDQIKFSIDETVHSLYKDFNVQDLSVVVHAKVELLVDEINTIISPIE